MKLSRRNNISIRNEFDFHKPIRVNPEVGWQL